MMVRSRGYRAYRKYSLASTPLTGKAGWLTVLTDWQPVGLQVCTKLQVQVYVSLGFTGLTDLQVGGGWIPLALQYAGVGSL